MCGISGFCDFSKNFKKEPVLWERILTDMHHALAHRGSDSFGTYLDTHVGLSHARLSIRDIAGGSQPIIRQDGERTCAIVYNGEIYNTDRRFSPLGILFPPLPTRKSFSAPICTMGGILSAA